MQSSLSIAQPDGTTPLQHLLFRSESPSPSLQHGQNYPAADPACRHFESQVSHVLTMWACVALPAPPAWAIGQLLRRQHPGALPRPPTRQYRNPRQVRGVLASHLAATTVALRAFFLCRPVPWCECVQRAHQMSIGPRLERRCGRSTLRSDHVCWYMLPCPQRYL